MVERPQPLCARLQAGAGWETIDFISDLHLHEGDAATFEAWRGYMADTPAQAVFILGDLFEVWVGDDAVAQDAFLRACAEVLRDAARTRAVYLLHGNRDFLVGTAFARSVGLVLLDDPTLLVHSTGRYLLTHGDALCLEDRDYLRFRAQVRDAAWQRAFLAKPLDERLAIALGLRAESQARKDAGTPYADVDREAALQWLRDADAGVMVHGHTHRPADHALDAQHRRIVLSDWDLSATPPRAQVLRLTADGLQRLRLTGADPQRLRLTEADPQRLPLP